MFQVSDIQSYPKYIFVSGGVLSGVGKGITTASLAFLLKSRGYKVNTIKCDMYLNMDAGTMNPIEHGEVFVTNDKAETDQDLGHYERFLNQDLSGKNYITAGQIYFEVLNKERRLEYQGKTVDTYQEIPEEIIRRIESSSKGYDISIVELGGTVGEYQNIMFFEAIRRVTLKRPDSSILIHLGYLPLPPSLGELKSKPLQQSIYELNSLGLRPDFIIARAEKELDLKRREKIGFSASISSENVISNPDVKVVYEVPLILERQNFSKKVLKKLKINIRKIKLKDWKKMVTNAKSSRRNLNIAIVAKYISSGDYSLEDAYVCVVEAVKHSSWAKGLKPVIKWIDAEKLEKMTEGEMTETFTDIDGVIVPQGWGSRGVEGKIKAIQYARENKIPFLGLCFGMQMAAIEFARNVCALKKANSEEVDEKTSFPIIHIMKHQKEYLAKKQFGGTIRLGAWNCKVKRRTLLHLAYKKDLISERHRHRYEFNNEYREKLSKKGLIFSGLSPDGKLVEAIELPQSTHPFFVGVQFHPELLSRPLAPHPLFDLFIEKAREIKYKAV